MIDGDSAGFCGDSSGITGHFSGYPGISDASCIIVEVSQGGKGVHVWAP